MSEEAFDLIQAYHDAGAAMSRFSRALHHVGRLGKRGEGHVSDEEADAAFVKLSNRRNEADAALAALGMKLLYVLPLSTQN